MTMFAILAEDHSMGKSGDACQTNQRDAEAPGQEQGFRRMW